MKKRRGPRAAAPDQKTKFIQGRVPIDLALKVQEILDRTGSSWAWLIRQAMVRYLEESKVGK